MRRGKYEISPPHTAQIPKDNGEFRTVYVNEPMDRVVLGIANDLRFELDVYKRQDVYRVEGGTGHQGVADSEP